MGDGEGEGEGRGLGRIKGKENTTKKQIDKPCIVDFLLPSCLFVPHKSWPNLALSPFSKKNGVVFYCFSLNNYPKQRCSKGPCIT